MVRSASEPRRFMPHGPPASPAPRAAATPARSASVADDTGARPALSRTLAGFHPLRKGRPGGFRTVGPVAALLIALVLAVQFGGSWYALELMRVSREIELERRLEDLGRAVEPRLRDPAARLSLLAYEVEITDGVEDAVAAYRGAADPADLAVFGDLAEAARLRSAVLLDPSGRVLYSSLEKERALDEFEFLSIDRAAFEEALEGRGGASIAYTSGERPLKRFYLPIREADDGEPFAVVALEAGADHLGEQDRLAVHLRNVTAVSSVLLLAVGWLLYRILMRQRRFELRGAHADRLSSLGTIAAGFAHEIRNPLGIIGACAEDLRKSLASHGTRPGVPPEADESCADILGEVERLDRLVAQFLQYARPEESSGGADLSPARLARTLGSAISMLRRTAERTRVRIEAELGGIPADYRVRLPEGGLRQVAINLVMNAVQASPEGGLVRVRVETDARRARILVSDEGPGVSPEARERIFDPFFTTRSEGSGLGLAIAHQLVSRAGGSLELLPKGPGATFEVTLPRAPDAPPGSRRSSGGGDFGGSAATRVTAPEATRVARPQDDPDTEAEPNEAHRGADQGGGR